MARPAKAASTRTGNMTKNEKNDRVEQENRIRGEDNALIPPDYLTNKQKSLFNYIVEQLKTAEILGNLDAFILAQAAISIDRLSYIEDSINKDAALLFDSKFMASKDKYTKDFFRCCNELSLSPQSRAKLANQFVQSKKDPLLEALADDDDD
ncbi:P27 family phage terminase small subunit [Eubacterium maltosivorans]|uniref:P27 family phage terminase small subunit n=1 Tax=Eubacterium maltosivorans TaxID=2041044 RepID=UPI003A955F39